MDGEGAGGPVLHRVQQALFEHETRPGEALLAGLEHEQHRARQAGLHRGQQPGRPNQHGGVQIMPAGVHEPVIAAGELQAGLFRHRQGVHVGPEQGYGTGMVTLQHRHDPAGGLVEHDVERQAFQRFEHDPARLGEVVAPLGRLMQ